MSTVGITNLKSFLGVVIATGMVLEPIMADGKVSWVEGVSSATRLAPELITLVNLDYSMLVKEWIDLDEAELNELDQFVKDSLQLTKVDTELFIEQAFSICIALSVEARRAVNLFKGLRDGQNT